MPRADGTMTIEEMIASVEDGEEPADPREGKPWPEEEDCPGCPGQRDGEHKFSCAYGGVRRLVLTVKGPGER
jgi:hypothetical protein